MGCTIKKTLTVFTPTYNRAYILPQLYDSLKTQTSKDFLWLIVDDGSKDDTESLVSQWIDEKIVEIQYIRQDNGGKMLAHNVGVENTKTELFVCVDSDDWLVPTSVAEILDNWEKVSCDEKQEIAGFVAYRGRNENQVFENEFPAGLTKATLSGLYEVGFLGETTLVFITDVIRKYPFPIIHGERFIPEAYAYDQIDQNYTYRLIPSIMIVCEYRADGLTNNALKLSLRNPCGYTAYSIQRANLSKTLADKIKNCIRANCFRHQIKGKNLPVTIDNKLLYDLTSPLGLILFYRKKRTYQKLQKGK